MRKKKPYETKDEKFTFTGDINLKNGIEVQKYNNFIFDTLIEYCKDNIKSLNKYEEDNKGEYMSKLKDSLDSLISNFQKEINSYNSEF